jgi:ureidoacrylate peracid hydrolase
MSRLYYTKEFSRLRVASGGCIDNPYQGDSVINKNQETIAKHHELSRRKLLSLSGALAITLTQGKRMLFAAPRHTSVTSSIQQGRRVTIPAKAAPIEIDLSATAVIVVDMQNDFVSKGGMMDRLGIDISMIRKAIPPTASVIVAARQLGMTIIYLKMGFRQDLSDVGPVDSPNWKAQHWAGVGTKVDAPEGHTGRILVRDTWNTAVVAELKPEPADIEIYKHRYSGFFQTNLDATLKSLGIRYLVVTGCTTSVCVESTIRDAMFLDYSPVLLADCTGEPLGNDLPRSNHDASLFLISGRTFGWVSSSGLFLEAVKRPA